MTSGSRNMSTLSIRSRATPRSEKASTTASTLRGAVAPTVPSENTIWTIWCSWRRSTALLRSPFRPERPRPLPSEHILRHRDHWHTERSVVGDGANPQLRAGFGTRVRSLGTGPSYRADPARCQHHPAWAASHQQASSRLTTALALDARSAMPSASLLLRAIRRVRLSAGRRADCGMPTAAARGAGFASCSRSRASGPVR